MDQLTSPGGFLGGFVLVGIMLPISISFVLDGIVLYFRGRGPLRLMTTAGLTLVIIGLYSLAWQNALNADEAVALSGSIGLILWFSIPAAVLGFGVRMLALVLNPTSKAQDQQAIESRKARRVAREASHALKQAQGVA